jgi:RHS repeat-associated protein
MGRRTGFWVCNGSTQPSCAGQGGPYGFVINPQGVRLTSGTDTTMGPFALGYDDFNRLSSVNRYNGVQTFSNVYDRYGNRWQQNAPQGGPTLSVSFNAATNQINTAGFTYNAAGQLTNDTFHSYSYDAVGNLLKVDGGSTAQYVYDALNHRVRTQDGNGTNEYLYDPAGKRISTWVASSNFGSEGRIYWGDQQLAFRSTDGTTYFDHQDWTGTERVRTNYAGSTAALYASFAYGDQSYAFNILNPSSGYNQDNAFYAGLDYDSGSGTDHAMFRQYTPLQGRWMSPDPYSGSYDESNPQSFNRYSYALNNPAVFTDPSGLQSPSDDDPAPSSGSGCNIECEIFTFGVVAAAGEIGNWISGLFSGPSFHGTLEPRPAADTDPNGVYTFQVNAWATPLSSNITPSAVVTTVDVASLVNYGQAHLTSACKTAFTAQIPRYSTPRFFRGLRNAPIQQYPPGSSIPQGISPYADAHTATDLPGKPIMLLPNFYGNSQSYQAFTLIHEGIHRFTGWTDQQVFNKFSSYGLNPPSTGYGTGGITDWLRGGC